MIKRLNYFKGLFLKVQDFTDEQEYHRQMLRLHNRYSHTWGILEGLMVAVGAKGLTISPGTAIDQQGRLMQLPQEESMAVADFPASEFFVTISYYEKETDPREETGIRGYTRISEHPRLHARTSPKANEIVLAKITRSQQNNTNIDIAPRRYSGISFFAKGDSPRPMIIGHEFENNSNGILIDSPWTMVKGRMLSENLKVTGATVMGNADEDDPVIVNGVIHPRRESNSKLPENRYPGRKLQVTGDIEFQQVLTTPKNMILSTPGSISLVCERGVYINKKPGSQADSGSLVVESNLSVLGKLSATSKDFVIDHPQNPEQQLVHSSLEGPESAVFYRGEAQLTQGRATVELPSYFESLTRPKGRTVHLTPKFEQDEEAISALAASAVSNGQFRVRAIDSHNLQQKFYWEVKAVRADIEPLIAERPKK